MTSHALTPPRVDSVLAIEHPGDGATRSRRVVTRSGARWRGKYPSWKVGRMLHWESQHELNAFRLLDADVTVLSFAEQPCVIRYRMGGADHSHYPDLLVERAGLKREIWEVKTARDAATPGVARRTGLMEAALPAMGYTYRVVVAEDLARQPRLDACIELLRFGRRAVGPLERQQAFQVLAAQGHISWGAGAHTHLGVHGLHILARLALEGAVTLDLERGVAEGTPFRAAAGR